MNFLPFELASSVRDVFVECFSLYAGERCLPITYQGQEQA